MAAKTPDSVSEPAVLGNKVLVTLTFSTTNLDDTDTIDGSLYMSTCEGVWFQPAADYASNLGLARSGSGNTTLTVDTSTDNQIGQVFMLGGR